MASGATSGTCSAGSHRWRLLRRPGGSRSRSTLATIHAECAGNPDRVTACHTGVVLPTARNHAIDPLSSERFSTLMRSFIHACVACMIVGAQAGVAPGEDVYTHPGLIVAASGGARQNFYC